MSKWIDSKTIVITGASSGIGRELTKMLIEKNDCYIIGIGRREDKFISLIKELGDKSDHLEYRLFDVSVESDWAKFAESIKDKKVDGLINNAGVLPPFAKFEILDERSGTSDATGLLKTMEINFNSVVYGTKYLTPIIETNTKPMLVNVASSAGLCALPGITMYSASKAAVKNFTEALSLEKDYYVGLVCPGFTKTEIFRNQTRSYESKLISFIATDLDKMTRKIYKGILKKKKRMVFGIDAKGMDILYRLFPKTSLKLFRYILKKANIDLFQDVFVDKELKND